MRYVLIVAGGSGKRLWPLSRQDMPKQLLKVVGGKSLLRIAYERLEGVVPDDRILVCTGADYADVVAAELPEVDPANILGEPEGRDSLNAVAWPAAVLAARDPDAVVAVVTADQIMHPVSAFQEALGGGVRGRRGACRGPGHVRGGADLAAHRLRLPARGVRRCPATPTSVRCAEFKEKPDRATAEEYLASGEYWWNSGMFVWRAPHAAGPARPAAAGDLRRGHGAGRRARTDWPRSIPSLLKISVDYAVMEPVSQGRAPRRWWPSGCRSPGTTSAASPSLSEQLPRDEQGNARHGASVLVDARDNLVINNSEDGRLVAVVGLSDTVIVQTPQITLVCPISEAERIKELVAEVTSRLGRSYA